MSAQVTVSIVTWNSARDIRACLESLQTQTFRDFSLTILDNASLDDTITIVREVFPNAAIIRKRTNIGFGAGHDQTIQLSRSPFILCLNPDTILPPDALTGLMSVMTTDDSIAAVGPKLLRFRLSNDENHPIEKSSKIDSIGIRQHPNGSFIERGANETDTGQYDSQRDTFAVSGACVLLRRTALEDIRLVNEYFDADFFAYKEDVDLCWRLHQRGWRILITPSVCVYHRRHVQTPKRAGNLLAHLTLRADRSSRIKWLSYRNHFLTHLKNQSTRVILRRLPWTFPYELGKFFFILFTEPSTLRGIPETLKLAPTILAKRRVVLRQRHQH